MNFNDPKDLKSSLYKIKDFDKLDPFLIAINSPYDHWMYISSTGCLTAGRQKPEYSIFPYVTDDILHRNNHFTGPVTIIKVKSEKKNVIWYPFSNRYREFDKQRNLYKNSLGNVFLIEEVNHTLKLTFHYSWHSSKEYGFIRKAYLINDSDNDIDVELIDGFRNLMPSGVELRTQQEMSNLANAYKVSEFDEKLNCSFHYLNALLMDKPQPGENLYANIAWSHSTSSNKVSVNEKVIEKFLNGTPFKEEHKLMGKPGSYLINFSDNISPGEKIYWYTVVDVKKSQVDIEDLTYRISTLKNLGDSLDNSIVESYFNFEHVIGTGDGFQCTNYNINDLHHTANVTYNVLRGGTFKYNYNIEKGHIKSFLIRRNNKIYEMCKNDIDTLPSDFDINYLIGFADKKNVPSLSRLCREYLPLYLGRRHGDPSRPWNHFNIKTNDTGGSSILYYEGNWRDIFQNWEALGISYPNAWESMVSIFLNATTLDGYNPYRITSHGIDWEIIDKDDSWSNIGYWNDHQIIYLLKLLEHFYSFNQTKVINLFNKRIFSHANVPYKIKSFNDIRRNPKDTIDFDYKLNTSIVSLDEIIGSDGRLILNDKKEVYHSSMCEKMLILSLAKICNHVPGAGIWLITQRPEWNDANNALVGNGASMVTVYYLRRFLAFFLNLIDRNNNSEILFSLEVWNWFEATSKVIQKLDLARSNHFKDGGRMDYVSQLGKIYEEYRTSTYGVGFSGLCKGNLKEVKVFLQIIISDIDKTIQSNQQKSGLFETYNTINIDVDNNKIDVEAMELMLEGQVAGLSLGLSDATEVITIVEEMLKSPLYREDMKSFILYPTKNTIPFLERNIISSDLIKKSKLLMILLRDCNNSIIEKDVSKNNRFNPNIRNRFDLENILELLQSEEQYQELVNKEKNLLIDIFEETFNHRNFTGRSGTMFSYEGIGSIYWHMVSKLLLAIQENFFKCRQDKDTSSKKLAKLGQLYYKVKDGLSSSKSPEEYGAFPFDPYSHSPSHSGAQQPGMTGQVKEEIITRFGELGYFVKDGCISFDNSLLKENEFLIQDKDFMFYNVLHNRIILRVKRGQLAFTICQVPVVYTLVDGKEKIEIIFNEKSKRIHSGKILDLDISKSIFDRTNEIKQIQLYLNRSKLLDN